MCSSHTDLAKSWKLLFAPAPTAHQSLVRGGWGVPRNERGPKGCCPQGHGCCPQGQGRCPRSAGSCEHLPPRERPGQPFLCKNHSPGAGRVLCMIRPRMDPVFRQRCKAALFLLLPQTSRRHRMPMRRQRTSCSPTSHSPEVMKTTSH